MKDITLYTSFFVLSILLIFHRACGQTVEIQCQHFYWRPSVLCPIPSIAPTAQVNVAVKPGTDVYRRCFLNQTYQVVTDYKNLYVKVQYGCTATFVITATGNQPTTTVPTTTVATTTTTTTTRKPDPAPLASSPSWNQWGAWSDCSVTCGGGVRRRLRTCSTGVDRDCASLFSYNNQAQTCNNADCPAAPVVQTQTQTIKPETASNAQSATSGQCGLANSFRIVGGTSAGACQFPWMVVVYNTRDSTICGGSIIDNTHILTAAHCVTSSKGRTTPVEADPSDILVLSGSSDQPFGVLVRGLRRTRASQVFRHESYNDRTLANDIAIVKLTTALPTNDCHRSICLPDGSKTPQQATGCRSMGWGHNGNGPDSSVQTKLQWVTETVASDDTCRRTYGSYGVGTTFCAKGSNAGSCQGDSGGPLACKEPNGSFVQYGIVSGGVENRCGQLQGLYTRVTSYLPWIKSKLAL